MVTWVKRLRFRAARRLVRAGTSLRWIAWLLQAAAGAAIGLYSLSTPKDFWSGWHVWLAVGGVGVIALGTLVTFRNSDRLPSYVSDVLSLAFHRLVENSSIDPGEVSLHAFLVGRGLRKERLRHVASVGPNPEYGSGVRWRIGKGPLGMSWRKRADSGWNLGEYWEGLDNAEQWNQAAAERRLDLTWAEADSLSRGAHVVVPILGLDDRFAAFVVAEGPSEYLPILWERRRRMELVSAGSLIRSFARA